MKKETGRVRRQVLRSGWDAREPDRPRPRLPPARPAHLCGKETDRGRRRHIGLTGIVVRGPARRGTGGRRGPGGLSRREDDHGEDELDRRPQQRRRGNNDGCLCQLAGSLALPPGAPPGRRPVPAGGLRVHHAQGIRQERSAARFPRPRDSRRRAAEN